jgi:transcriptional regulator with XRE-family HTH domain
MRIGERLRKARKAKGLTQGQVATALNIDRNTVNRIERGRSIPRADRLSAWASICGVSLGSLITDATFDTNDGDATGADVQEPAA